MMHWVGLKRLPAQAALRTVREILPSHGSSLSKISLCRDPAIRFNCTPASCSAIQGPSTQESPPKSADPQRPRRWRIQIDHGCLGWAGIKSSASSAKSVVKIPFTWCCSFRPLCLDDQKLEHTRETTARNGYWQTSLHNLRLYWNPDASDECGRSDDRARA
jgi:hypothetical protein